MQLLAKPTVGKAKPCQRYIRNGILVVTQKNLCGRQVTEADFDGQNGKRHDIDVKGNIQ